MVCLVNFNKNIIYLVSSPLHSTKRFSSILMRKRKIGYFLPFKVHVSRFTFPQKQATHQTSRPACKKVTVCITFLFHKIS